MGFECSLYKMKRYKDLTPNEVEKIDNIFSENEDREGLLDDEYYFYKPLFVKQADSWGDLDAEPHIYQEMAHWCSSGRKIDESIRYMTKDNYDDCYMHGEITQEMLIKLLKSFIDKLNKLGNSGYITSAVFHDESADDLGYRIKECDGIQFKVINDDDKPYYLNFYNSDPITIIDYDSYEDLMYNIVSISNVLVNTDFTTEMVGFAISY